MEALIQHMVEGQKKLEWAVERQLTSAQADRDLLKELMKGQRETLQAVGHATPREPEGQRSTTPAVSLQKYTPGEDPDGFLLNFERAARASGWPVSKWPFFLAQLLTGEAQAAYQVANATGNSPYEEVKTVILDHLGLDAETYRIRFRREKGAPGDTPKTLYLKLKLAADKWLKPTEHSKEDIMNAIYLEQFIEALPYPTQRWLRQHGNLTPEQAVEMAASFSRAQLRHPSWEPEKPTKPTPSSTKPLRPIREPERIPPPRVETHPVRGPQCFDLRKCDCK